MPWSTEDKMRELIQRKLKHSYCSPGFEMNQFEGLRFFSHLKGELGNQSGPSSIPTL